MKNHKISKEITALNKKMRAKKKKKKDNEDAEEKGNKVECLCCAMFQGNKKLINDFNNLHPTMEYMNKYKKIKVQLTAMKEEKSKLEERNKGLDKETQNLQQKLSNLNEKYLQSEENVQKLLQKIDQLEKENRKHQNEQLKPKKTHGMNLNLPVLLSDELILEINGFTKTLCQWMEKMQNSNFNVVKLSNQCYTMLKEIDYIVEKGLNEKKVYTQQMLNQVVQQYCKSPTGDILEWPRIDNLIHDLPRRFIKEMISEAFEPACDHFRKSYGNEMIEDEDLTTLITIIFNMKLSSSEMTFDYEEAEQFLQQQDETKNIEEKADVYNLSDDAGTRVVVRGAMFPGVYFKNNKQQICKPFLVVQNEEFQ
ncbi:hypothetical protein ABK040_014671 [Willaertia magna]